jgi:predicted HNH restriction endonuclease
MGQKYDQECLQVHHLTYARKGCEQLVDLQVLCADCHKGEHQVKMPWLLDSLTQEFRDVCR